MAERISVTGGAQFHALARACREAGRTDLLKAAAKGLRASGEPIGKAIRESAPEYVPSGYAEVFTASLYFRTEVRTAADPRVTLVVKGRGAKGHDRQVDKIEAGNMRAPNWGRYRSRRGRNAGRHKIRNQWHTQRVRAHFATEPARAAAPKVAKLVEDELRTVAEKIERAV